MQKDWSMTGHKLFKLGLYGPCENMWMAFVTSPVGLHRYSQFWCQPPPCFQLEGTSKVAVLACDDGTAIETKSLEEILNRLQFPLGTSLSAPWGLSRKRRPHAATAPVTIQEGHYPFWWQWWWRLSLTCTVEELCVCVWIATHANEICSWKWWSHDVKLTATGAANSVE